MTTPRENLLKVYRHEEPDWVPIVALADGYNRPSQMPASYYEDIQGMSPSRALSRYFELDVLDRVGGYTEHYRNVGYTKTVEGKLETERWETPYGTITLRALRTEYALQEGAPLTSLARVEYPVKSVADLRAFAYIFENLEYEFHPQQVAQRVDAVGGERTGDRGSASKPAGNVRTCLRGHADAGLPIQGSPQRAARDAGGDRRELSALLPGYRRDGRRWHDQLR